MKKRTMASVLTVETLLLTLLLFCGCLSNASKELLREDSPDGVYQVVIWERGCPDWPFGKDHLEVGFFSKDVRRRTLRTVFRADVANDGAPAGYQVEWIDMGVRVTLSGSGQPHAVYVLPYPQRERTG